MGRQLLMRVSGTEHHGAREQLFGVFPLLISEVAAVPFQLDGNFVSWIVQEGEFSETVETTADVASKSHPKMLERTRGTEDVGLLDVGEPCGRPMVLYDPADFAKRPSDDSGLPFVYMNQLLKP